MRKIELRYVFLCVAIISISLAVWRLPPPELEMIDGSIGGLPRPNALHTFLFLNVQPYTTILGIATLMHLISGMLGLVGFLRWIFAISAPTIVAYEYQIWWLDNVSRNSIHYPVSISPATVLILNLLNFTIGFCVISLLLYILFPRMAVTNKRRSNGS